MEKLSNDLTRFQVVNNVQTKRNVGKNDGPHLVVIGPFQ
jgi:hypothetical protein